MALNIAVPLSGVADMLGDNFNLLSPSSFECRTSNKLLCSPIDSESSGISSLDSDEIKKSSVSSSPTEDEQNSSDQCQSTPSIITSELSTEQKTHLLSPKPKHATATTAKTTDKIDTSEVEKTEDCQQLDANYAINLEKENLTNEIESNEHEKRSTYELRINANGRNILDLSTNLLGRNMKNSTNSDTWQQDFIQYAHLPQNNLKMFLENRSQYHRLGANGHLQEYTLVDCKCCDFTYPVNGNTNSTSSDNIIKSIKTNLSEQMGNDGNIFAKAPGAKNDFSVEHLSTFTRPSTQNQYMAAPKSATLKQQRHEPTPNFDISLFNNNITALNRTVTNQPNNNILENIAAALLNTTNNVSAINHLLNQKQYNNNTHHFFNNQQQHNFTGYYNYGNKNHYTSHSYSYKPF